MTTIVHRTPGILDTRSFTVMGMSAKPGTTAPIGQFGTGLKYSIAGLLRSGAAVDIWVGREHWQFALETEDFRGATFTRIYAWVRQWGGLRRRKIMLPFTTQLGPHWVPWMWMRELHSNTLDEGGETWMSRDTWSEGPGRGDPVWESEEISGDTRWLRPEDGQTLIIVEHPDYASAWEARQDVFHPTALGPAAATPGAILEAIPSAPHGRLYYRGLRVLDLRLPSVTCAWNILESTPLTEDRTMHEFFARAAIARWLVRDCADQDLIAVVLDCDEHHWEYGLEFPHHIRPSETFERAARSIRRPTMRLGSYISAYTPPPPPDTRTFWERRGRRWQVAEEQILDERGRPVVSQPDGMAQEDWCELSGLIIEAVLREPEPPAPRAMDPWDLYAGLSHHKWHYDYDRDPPTIDCRVCGVWSVDMESDLYYGECQPPAWMLPEPIALEDDIPFP